MCIKNSSVFTRKTKISINRRKIQNIKEFYETLDYLKNKNLLDYKPIIYSKPIDVFDCLLIRIRTTNFDSTDYAKIKDLLNISIATKESENNIFILIPLRDLFKKYSLSDIKYFLEDNFDNYSMTRLNNVEIWSKKDCWFIIEDVKSGSDKYFFITKHYIIVTSNVKKYPKQIIIRFRSKLFNLLKKIVIHKTTKNTLKRLSKYQYNTYKLLLSSKLLQLEKIYKARIFKIKETLKILLMLFIYGIKHCYNCYISEKKKGKFDNFQEFINWFIRCWET